MRVGVLVAVGVGVFVDVFVGVIVLVAVGVSLGVAVGVSVSPSRGSTRLRGVSSAQPIATNSVTSSVRLTINHAQRFT